MNGYIPQEIVEELKHRTNIVDLISEFVTLKKAGRYYVGLCPFHKEKTPSFTVNPEKQIYRCYGCGEGGNVYSFLMKVNNCTFPEAVRHLASRAGVEIPLQRMAARDKGKRTERENLLTLHRMAADYYRKSFSSEKGRPAREYLAARGVGDSLIETFQIGYAPGGWGNLRSYFAAAKISQRLAESAGLLVVKNESACYDRFRNRLMLPIENVNGDIIAFGGRALGDEEPKYLNSPESPLYIKGDNLYGLYRTKGDIQHSDSCIIVEGYFDLLSLWNAGIKNVIATLGTALTPRQVELIRRFTRKVVLLFDGDAGGRTAIERSLPLFLEAEVRARIVQLPEGHDPDDYVRTYGRDAMDGLIARAPSMVDYYIDTVMGDNRSMEEKAELAGRAVSFISSISDVIQRNLFIKRVAEKLGLDEALIKDQVKKAPTKRSAPEPNVPSDTARVTEKLDPIELYGVYLMVEYSHKIPLAQNEQVLEYFTDLRLKAAARQVCAAYDNRQGVTISTIADSMDDMLVRDALLKLAMEDASEDEEIIDRVFYDTILKIKAQWYKERHRMLMRQMVAAREKGDTDLCSRLLLEKKHLLGEEKRLRSQETCM